MKKGLLVSILSALLISGFAFAAPVFDDSVQSDESVSAINYQQLLKRSNQSSDAFTKLFGAEKGSMMKVNMACGLKPLPPLGCQVGACMCDQYGQNCQWTFICR